MTITLMFRAGLQRWDPQYEDKIKEIKKLKIDVSKIDEDVVIGEDPVSQYKLKFMQTGDYLRPHDMRYRVLHSCNADCCRKPLPRY